MLLLIHNVIILPNMAPVPCPRPASCVRTDLRYSKRSSEGLQKVRRFEVLRSVYCFLSHSPPYPSDGAFLICMIWALDQ